MEVTNMFKEARVHLDAINAISSWEQERREEVYKEFVSTICQSNSKKEKEDAFKSIENWTFAMEAVEPKTYPHCSKIREMLDEGATIMCGGT